MARSGYLATVVILARHHEMARTRRIALSLRSALRFRRVHPEDTEDDAVVWDVPNPFAPPDPSHAHLHSLIQAEIARMRRCESIGPLQSLPDDDDDDEDEDDDDDDDDEYSDDDEDNDADDEDDEDDDSYSDHESTKVLLPLPPDPPPSDTTSTSTSDGDWNHLAQVYNDLAEAKELERARKAKRDAHRSRLKALAILGPEALSALHLQHTHISVHTDL